MVDKIVGMVLVAAAAVLAIFLIGAAYEGWDWWNFDHDFNRQVTNISYVQQAGIDPTLRYDASAKFVQQTADAPSCMSGNTNLFNADGATDNALGPGMEVAFPVGPSYALRTVSLTIPMSKVDLVNTGGKTRVQLVYQKLVYFYDNNWDPLVDTRADGAKGQISRCVAGLSIGQIARIGLKRVIVFGEWSSNTNSTKTSVTASG